MNYKIDESRRSGSDRRKVETREGSERRVVMADKGSYISLIQKIPLFKGLGLSQFKAILRICARQNYRQDETIIHDRAESREMYILIKGTLKVVLSDGTELLQIKPVDVVGEMGVITGDIRSAAVVAAEESTVLAIRKRELLHVFHKDSELAVIILTNVIRGLSGKVRHSNEIIDELRKAAESEDDLGKIFEDWEEEHEEEL